VSGPARGNGKIRHFTDQKKGNIAAFEGLRDRVLVGSWELGVGMPMLRQGVGSWEIFGGQAISKNLN